MRWWWKLAVSVSLLALILILLPAGDIFGAMGRIPAWLWTAALAGFLSGHLLGVAKWRAVINAGRPILKMRQAIQCYAAGLFAKCPRSSDAAWSSQRRKQRCLRL